MNFKELKEKPPRVDDETKSIIQNFLKFASKHIKLDDLPKIKLYSDPKLASARRSFGGYMGGRIELNVGNRHIMDVLRTLAHELVHYKQDSMGVLTPDSGEDGSEHENEANAKAAVIMRLWGKMNPELFQHAALLAEAYPNQQKALYKPDGVTYRGKPMPTMEPDPVDDAVPLSRRPKGSYELNTDPIEGKKWIMRYWDKLKPNQQRVIKMRYWDEMSYDEIGDELNLTKNRIRQIEMKALRVLRYYFQNDNIENPIQLNELNVAQTLKFIKQAHGDQLYGSLPYWRHPRAVALTGKKIFGSRFTSDAVKTAFLHDVVEDTHIGIDELSKLDFTPQVIQAVSLLTKNKSLTYRQNIEAIINSGNPLAMMVKYADNYENYTGDKSSWEPERAASSQKKYLMSLNMLGAKLGVKHHL